MSERKLSLKASDNCITSIFDKQKYFSSFEAGNCVSNSSFKWMNSARWQWRNLAISVLQNVIWQTLNKTSTWNLTIKCYVIHLYTNNNTRLRNQSVSSVTHMSETVTHVSDRCDNSWCLYSGFQTLWSDKKTWYNHLVFENIHCW